jgi:DNA polymerase elongation subunit (family B)
MKQRDGCKGAARSALQERINTERVKQKPFREERQRLKKSKPNDVEDENGNKISGVICAKRRYRFLKAEIKKGVIPSIIQNLLNSRKRVRSQMKDAPDSSVLVLDKEQLAYKVSANSMYGAMGVRRGYLPFMPGAMCVTYFGRKSIELTAKLVVEKWGATLVYADTDSNYVTFSGDLSPQETWDYAVQVADEISKEFPEPMRLEFEQAIYERFFILSKKRYMYQQISREGVLSKKVGKKGVILARRDNSGFLRKIYENVATMIFEQEHPDTIEHFVIDRVNDIFRNNVPYTDYIITKSIGDTSGDVNENSRIGDYKVKQLPEDEHERLSVLKGKAEKDYYISQCPAHVQLAERMRKRGVPVDAGSRIEFIVLKRDGSLGDKVEDYDHFKKRSDILRIDPLYYLHTLINPLDQMLSVIRPGSAHFMKELYTYHSQFLKVMEEVKHRGYARIRR